MLTRLAQILVLGVAAVAMPAADAEAVEIHSESESTVLTGAQNTSQVFTTSFGTIECEEETASGTLESEASSEFDLYPEYPECVAFGSFTAAVDMNGCSKTFTLPLSWPPAPEIHVKCPAGKDIEITVGSLCTITITPGTPGSVSLFENEGEGTGRRLNLTEALEGIEYSGSGLFCSGSYNDGEYSGSTTVAGEDAEGNPVGIWVE